MQKHYIKHNKDLVIYNLKSLTIKLSSMPDEVKCPKCSSTQITAQKKGFSGTKAVGGAILTGGIGLLAGMHGSGDIIVYCLACGYSWNPKKLMEENGKREKMDKMREDIRNSSETNKWRKDVVNAYEAKDIETATNLFLSRREFNDKIPNIDQAYDSLKMEERAGKFIKGFAVFLILAIIIWLMSK